MDPATLLKTARRRAGLTQAQVASRAGVDHSMVSAYERGRRQPGFATLERLLAAVGTQLRIDLAPLAVPLDTRIEQALAMSPENRTKRLSAVLDRLSRLCDGLPFAVDGLAAAALQGAPVEVTEVAVLLGDDDDVVEAFSARLETVDRIWDPDRERYIMLGSYAPAVRVFDPTRWQIIGGGRYSIHLSPSERLAGARSVLYGGGQLPVVGLWELELGDPDVAAVLVRTREILAERGSGE